MSSTRDAIKRVVEAFERSGWTEIDVRSGDVRIHLSTVAPTGSESPPPRSTARADPVVADGPPGEATVPATRQSEPPPATLPDPQATDGAHLVVSPTPGIFWRSPEPGLPPFADIGVFLDASSTVCIVEVMKLMNHVKAGVSGEVVAVYAENGVAVHKGQPLFAIARSDSA